MADGSEQNHRGEESDADGGGDEHGELLEDHVNAAEEEEARPSGGDHARQDADAHFSVGLLDLVVSGTPLGVGIVRGKVNHVVD